jgi:drug/metabolite transporter (DMT)-like permease
MNNARRPHLDSRAVLLLVMCSVLWGLAQTAAKVALQEVPPLLQVAIRSIGAALLLLGWCQWRQLRIWQADGTAAGGLWIGVLFAIEFACIFIGLQYTSASRMAVFLYMAPFVVAIGMPFIARGEALRPTQTAGLVLAFAGVVWAFAEGFARSSAGPLQWLGDGLGLCAALFWGLTTLSLRRGKLSTALPEKTLLYQLVVSGLALLLGSLLKGEPWPQQLSPLVWASMLFQTVVVTFASYLVWFWLVRHYPATRISAFTLLTPIFGLLAGVLLLHEPLTLRLVTALVAVCLGIWWVSRPGPAAQTLDSSHPSSLPLPERKKP